MVKQGINNYLVLYLNKYNMYDVPTRMLYISDSEKNYIYIIFFQIICL